MIQDAVLTKYILLCGLERMWEEVSRPIWSTMWIRTDDTWWCLTKFEVHTDWNRCGRMLSRPKLKCYVDKTGDSRWCLEQIWLDISLGTDVIFAVLTKLQCYVNFIVCDRKFHDQFEVIFGLEQMIQYDVLT
jgi:hypothetical protein